MTRSQRPAIALSFVAALTVAACGGGDDNTSDAADAAAQQADSDPNDDGGDDGNGNDDSNASGESDTSDAGAAGDDNASSAGSGGDFEVPVARFTAHGPEAANTIAPPCGVGNVDKGGDLFRFTPPADFEWRGSSGGSGRDEITVINPDGVSLTLIEAVNPSELSLVDGYEVVGPSGVDITIDDTTIPITEVTAEGTTGYALVDMPYLEPVPLLQDGAALGTAIVYSDTEGRPTLDEATAILETIRVERCAALSESIIWAAGGGFAPVPRFEPDPLGKTWPDQPQPAIVGLPTLDAYSIEQIAYLMPVDEDRSMCAAEAALADLADDPLGYLQAFSPSGTAQADFDAMIAGC